MLNETLFEIEGVAPLLMNNVRKANPKDPLVKRSKEITAKKDKKTEQDEEELMKLDFMTGLYLMEDGAVPCVPGEMIEAVLRNGAVLANSRNKKKSIAGCASDGPWALEYDGPKLAEELWEHGGFCDCRMVNVRGSRVMRSRPMFRGWKLSFVVKWDPEIVSSEEELIAWLRGAGKERGMGDYRPKFGRFNVLKAVAV